MVLENIKEFFKHLPQISSISKHILHCVLLFSLLTLFEMYTFSARNRRNSVIPIDPWSEYGYLQTYALYLLRLLVILALPQALFNFFGLVLYDAFHGQVFLAGSPIFAPHICLRIVTRGDYPGLVRRNVLQNTNTCLTVGMENFCVEIVTEKPIGVEQDRRTHEIVVPRQYRTPTGALFKARALQYCLEAGVSSVQNDDWVVHLDEETLLTKDSVRGILNFVLDGKHPFGQGVITYAREPIVNWITTLADSYRVSDDMGKLRLQLKLFHRPLFGWKGSYVVTRLSAEKEVSFDHGLEGSIAEDCFFAMSALARGYTFNFIEGEMHEKSPFTMVDLLRQRKRWLQGIWLVVRSPAIPLHCKLLLGVSLGSWITLPLTTSNLILSALYPITFHGLIDYVCAFITGLTVYMYIFGVIKSFSLFRFGWARFLVYVIGALCTIPINALIENIAVVWGLFGKKKQFYVVQKDTPSLISV